MLVRHIAHQFPHQTPGHVRARKRAVRLAVAGVALVLILLSLWFLLKPLKEISPQRTWSGDTPVSIYRPQTGDGPVVVIAHGFAGSRPLMQTYALALARNGYTVVTYDLLGHGCNPEPLAGDLGLVDGASLYLLAQLDEVVSFARTLSPQEPRIALLGHSMSTDILVRYAATHDFVIATVTLSLGSPAVTAQSPKNLLDLVGDLERPSVKNEAMHAVGLVSGLPRSDPGVTYGSFADGSARRWVALKGCEHVGILFSAQGVGEASAWLDQAFGRPAAPNPYLPIMPWLALLLCGTILMGWPLGFLLPRVAPSASSGTMGWGTFLVLAVVPAVATPLVCLLLPTDFLQSLVGDYLIVHLGVYGGLTALGLWIARALGRTSASSLPGWPVLNRERVGKLVVATVLVSVYAIGAFVFPVNEFVTTVVPENARLAIVPIAFGGAVAYFLADETLVRGPFGSPGSLVLTRFLFLASLALAIWVDFHHLFFLIVLMPLVSIYLVVYTLLAWWAWKRTGHVAVGAIAAAVGLAMLIAAAFPVVSG